MNKRPQYTNIPDCKQLMKELPCFWDTLGKFLLFRRGCKFTKINTKFTCLKINHLWTAM